MDEHQTERDNNLLTTVEAARDELRCHPQTLNNWRSNGEGPPFVRVGRRVFYRRGDLRAWIQSHTVRCGRG